MSIQLRTLLVGTAGTDVPGMIVDYALALGRRVEAEVHVVHAFAPAPIPGRTAHEADMRLHGLQAAVARRTRGERVECHVMEGDAAECLAEVARQVRADLIMLGASRVRPGSGRASTADAVVRHARAPVLVPRAPLAPGRRRVLLLDGGHPAPHLRERAAALAHELFGAEPELRTYRTHAAGRASRRGRDEGDEGGAEPWAPGARGPAAGEWRAELVVAGASGPRDRWGAPAGSVTGAALDAAPCSVLVLPAGWAPRVRIAVPAAEAGEARELAAL